MDRRPPESCEFEPSSMISEAAVSCRHESLRRCHCCPMLPTATLRMTPNRGHVINWRAVTPVNPSCTALANQSIWTAKKQRAQRGRAATKWSALPRNPKSKIRNPKQIQNPKAQHPSAEAFWEDQRRIPRPTSWRPRKYAVVEKVFARKQDSQG